MKVEIIEEDSATNTFLKMGFKPTGIGEMEYQCLDGIHHFSIWAYKVGGSIGEIAYVHKTLDQYHPKSDTIVWDAGVDLNCVDGVLCYFDSVSSEDVKIMREKV